MGARSQGCGSWDSPISSADLVRGALRLSTPRIEAGRLFWLEGRPEEGGRQVVMTGALPGRGARGALRDVREVSPPGVSVRTRVHEYGGGAYAVHRERLFYVDDSDQRIYLQQAGAGRQPLVDAGASYADLVASPDGRWLFAVQERPRAAGEPENRLVAISLAASTRPAATPTVVAEGHDFYASLVVSPRADRVAWLAWDHPNMPWNGNLLETRAWGPEGPSGPVHRRAGGARESLFQPRFRADGTLFVVSDRSGWWNLNRVEEGGLSAVHEDAFELGRPQWSFGMSTWAFLGDASPRILASATEEGVDHLIELDPETGESRRRPTAFRSIHDLESRAGWVACVAGEAGRPASLQLWRGGLSETEPICVRAASAFEIPPESLSVGAHRTFPSAGGRDTHAFVYAPRSATSVARPGEKPPLLVKSHGGPTASTTAALDPRIQFWTSRGFAVADVNYGGSSGYGRAYRDLLEERWGLVDVEDCVAVASALAEEGSVDGERLAISGGSAGGYTTLCALTFHETFAAGASHYGIGDLEALVRDTHKFESRYTDWLVGPLPETRSRYVERSPIHHASRLACPVIFFQGLEDRVVPPNQAEAMVEVLAQRGLAHAYVAFEGEQHGFRRAENIRTALDGELYFYASVFGFEAPRPAGVAVVAERP